MASKLQPPLWERESMALGRLAVEMLDGAVPTEVHVTGRERFLSAIDVPPKTSRFAVIPIAAAAAVIIGSGIVFHLSLIDERKEVSFTIEGGSSVDNGHIRTDDTPAVISFSNGSIVEIQPHARVFVRETSKHSAQIQIDDGRLNARIVHSERVDWVIKAGSFTVSVVGTEFDVDWNHKNKIVTVDVHLGSVIVQGPPIAEGMRVASGQRFIGRLVQKDVQLEPIIRPGGRVAAHESGEFELQQSVMVESPEEQITPIQESAPRSPEDTAGPRQKTWRDYVADGRFEEVVDDAAAADLISVLKQRPLVDLMALSDAARYTKRYEVAERALVAQRSRFPRSKAAATAAFMLGRIAENRGRPRKSAQWYALYRVETPFGQLNEEALGRELVVYERLGEFERATTIAEEYLTRYPGGAFAKVARTVLRYGKEPE